MFDGAAKFSIMKMSTPDMKEVVEILMKEIKFRENENDNENDDNWKERYEKYKMYNKD